MINITILGYWVSEAMMWRQFRTQKWFRAIPLGPFLSFFLTLLLVISPVNDFLLKGKGIDGWIFGAGTVTLLVDSFDVHQVSYALIRYLITEVPPGSKVFVRGDDYEVIFEVGLYASRLQQQPITLYTSNIHLIEDLQKDYPYLQYMPDTVSGFASSSATSKFLFLRKKDWDVIEKMEPRPFQVRSARELQPAVSFGSIPDGANWEVVR